MPDTAELRFPGINLSPAALRLRKEAESLQEQLAELEHALANEKRIPLGRRFMAIAACVVLQAQINAAEKLIAECPGIA